MLYCTHPNKLINKQVRPWPWSPWIETFSFFIMHCTILFNSCTMECEFWKMDALFVQRLLMMPKQWVNVFHRNAFTNKFIQFWIQSKLYSMWYFAGIWLNALLFWHPPSSRAPPFHASNCWNVVICTTLMDSNALNCILLSDGNWIL